MSLIRTFEEEFPINSERIFTIEEYFEKFDGLEGYEYLKKKQQSNTIVQCGMLKWDDDDAPEHWGGAFPNNMVYFQLEDHRKDSNLSTAVKIFENTKNYAYRSRFNRSLQALLRAGFNDDYWVRPYMGQLCSFSEMSDEEIKAVEAVETPEEKLQFELKYHGYLASNSGNPYNQISIDRPFKLYLCGNDDCSYSMYFNWNEEDYFENILHPVKTILTTPSWYDVHRHCHFTN